MEKRYRIAVKVLTGQTLGFTVSKYWVEEGTLLCFIDEKTNKPLRFDSRNCQITEVD